MLKIEYVKTADLIPYANNPRRNDAAVDKVVESIREFGFKNPIIVDGNNEIIAGHTRLKAAEKLGMEEVPTIKAEDLTPEQVRAFRIADNKTHEFAEWDMDLLREELDGVNLFTGFDEDELREILDNVKFSEVEEDDFDPTPPEEPKTKLGDIYQLGRHRLMCGDATKKEDVDRLMDGKKADMVFIDPPYGVKYTGGLQFKDGEVEKNNRQMIKNDESDDIYTEVIPVIASICNGPCYTWFADTKASKLYTAVEAVGDIHSMIIWVKNGGYGALNANYKQKHESCLYWKPRGKKLNFVGATTETTVWEICKDGINKLHPTQKPVELAAKAIKNHSAGLIVDLFGGSGSTLIACEQLNRTCYMMEIDPKYIDVIINRWEQFTGQKAVRLNG
ncbi:MAG TPA: DNA methyltransferase [Acetomicrobium sp.]|nr:DNA methyltransferase [Acetomicrobium sp.]